MELEEHSGTEDQYIKVNVSLIHMVICRRATPTITPLHTVHTVMYCVWKDVQPYNMHVQACSECNECVLFSVILLQFRSGKYPVFPLPQIVGTCDVMFPVCKCNMSSLFSFYGHPYNNAFPWCVLVGFSLNAV